MNMSIFRLLSASALARTPRSKQNWNTLHTNLFSAARTQGLLHQHEESNGNGSNSSGWAQVQGQREIVGQFQRGEGVAFEHNRIGSSDQLLPQTLQHSSFQWRSFRAAATAVGLGPIGFQRKNVSACHDATRQYSSRKQVSNEGRASEKQTRKEEEVVSGAHPKAESDSSSSSIISSRSSGSNSAGWSYEEACTVPNLVSLARALSAPWLGLCIINDQWEIAIAGTLVAGFSDWLDGYLAKRMKNQSSSLGSYLDPLADKVMITCLTIATGYKGLIDPAVCGCIIGRDVLLLGGAFAHRAHLLNWKWDSWQEYFRVMPSKGNDAKGAEGTSEGQAPVAPMVKPIFLSKLNTVFQIGLVVSAISHGAVAWPDQQFVEGLGYLTAATTVASGAIYVRMYLKGQMLA